MVCLFVNCVLEINEKFNKFCKMASEISDYEKLRLKNIAERQKCFDDFMKQNGVETFNISKVNRRVSDEVEPVKRKVVRKRSYESAYRSLKMKFEKTAAPVRRSSRISSGNKKYSEGEGGSGSEENCESDASQEFEFLPDFPIRRKSVKRVSRRSESSENVREILSVDDVTAEMLAKIAVSSKKVYNKEIGSSCHQCRQKTLDTKSVCRSPDCIGVRGQFCGPCLKNRYGESVREALLDPEWVCPPCRDLCNCSICRNRNGLKPTGILVPLLRDTEYSNVSDFLNFQDCQFIQEFFS